MGSKIGVYKVAASRAGLSLEEYIDHLANHQKRCVCCKQWRHRSNFTVDSTRGDGLCPKCSECVSKIAKAKYIPIPKEVQKPKGPPRLPRRSGDKVQARARINADVRLGLRPNPNELFCANCGHRGPDRRHEYHHHLGYAPEHHNDVISLCTTCHHEADRLHDNQQRGSDGRYVN